LTEKTSPSASPGSGPSVPPEGTDDPSGLFDRPEPVEPASPRTVLLWQYFLFPLLIVAAAVGVFLAFGLIAGDQPSPSELLEEMTSGGENEKDQAAQQLGLLIARERMRVDAARGTDASPPFYADPAFREGLRRALDHALAERDADVRAQAVVLMVGRTQDVGALDRLARVLYPAEGAPAVAPRTRTAAAMAVWYLDAPAALDLIARMTRDDDAEVRAVAYLALARLGDEESAAGGPLHGDPRAVDLLRAGLKDVDGGARLNAAVGLAVHGDDAGAGFVERSLDRASLATAGIEDPDMQRAALLNGIKGARLLGSEGLRHAVQRLAEDDREDDVVREAAREALSRWKER